MKLQPNIASYNANYYKMKTKLTDEYIDIIYGIATGSANANDIKDEVINDLIDMHIVKKDGNSIKLNTAVFLADDIRKIYDLVSDLGSELARKLVENRSILNNVSPEIKNFLGGIVGVTQGLSRYNYENNIAIEWKNYTGQYAKTKVDFDEFCDLSNSIGEHLFNKTILVGEKYTAVFIGPGGNNYSHLFSSLYSLEGSRNYIDNVLRYLTDSYAMLLESKIRNEHLRQSAEQVNIFEGGRPKDILISRELFQEYSSSVNQITEISCEYYSSKLGLIFEVLRTTTAGRQGVSPENMLMHFWRYFSKILAKKLYEYNFLTDNIPQIGSITVFFDNEIDELSKLFS